MCAELCPLSNLNISHQVITVPLADAYIHVCMFTCIMIMNPTAEGEQKLLPFCFERSEKRKLHTF